MLHHLQDCGHLIPQTNIYLFILHEPGYTMTCRVADLIPKLEGCGMCSFDPILACHSWIGRILQYP
ncbi:hypothetical protein JHK82_033399 [Glycine max]|uniref:Uncharacterized protein n=2 Tax=Glycine subgen. Soja TaxID=1462606 RepID=A0A0R0H3Z1_SOYBN|nr:hypothetical protein JHK87_033337 [Glycine soja]KAG4980162.1 hypothetical protein JHK85_034120 [Glycine max]KAG4985795.1 hypothetical protein JHK86_033486 [Glycine max]KAG5118979.1 hypothetical protein JHK82_033399 [Glycine max]KAG5139972.1 hypothetical protein JHK84_033740 [Glycine max]